VYEGPRELTLDLAHYHERARTRGVNPIVYWLTRAVLQPTAHLYWRLSRIGREHIPQTGGVIIASNHRSFMDPFLIGLMTRRPVYYMAKSEIFEIPVLRWFVSALGAFPVRRGAADVEAVETSRAILARGGVLVIFPEGTRTRPGALGKPKRGVGRLVLEAGVPVVPIALIGTEAIRKGWRIRPKKVRIRAGGPLRFPKMEQSTGPLAARVTDRIWPNVMLQWEWLGGLPPLRRAAVVGSTPWSAAMAAMLARAGVEVDYAGEAPLPPRVKATELETLQPDRYDLVAFGDAGTAEALAPQIPPRTGVLQLGPEPARLDTRAWATASLVAPADPSQALDGAQVVLSAPDRAFARQLEDALSAAGLNISADPSARIRETVKAA
jgi:1-acyl-sn-glycerol-3-phosphate acyltransferase